LCAKVYITAIFEVLGKNSSTHPIPGFQQYDLFTGFFSISGLLSGLRNLHLQ
jgi:hypothetical protein